MDKISFENELIIMNETAKRKSKEADHERNYVHLFRPYVSDPLNVVGSFQMAISSEEARGGIQEHFCGLSACSFGMIAAESFDHYRELVLEKDSPFATSKSFEEFVNRNCHNFCIDEGEYQARKEYYGEYSLEQYRMAFFARCAIANSWAFRFAARIQDDPELLEALKADAHIRFVKDEGGRDAKSKTANSKTLKSKILKSKILKSKTLKSKTLKSKTFNSKTGKDNDTLDRYFIFGRMDANLIAKFRDREIILESDFYGDRTVEIGKLYQMENLAYFDSPSDALYSGVIPRLLLLDYIKPSLANRKIHKIQMNLGRTSFMTMNAFNHRQTDALLRHPFLNMKRAGNGIRASMEEVNRAFDRMEYALQKRYYEEMEQVQNSVAEGGGDRFESEVKALNHYLESSWNIHNVNISGNVISAENQCIYVQRAKSMSDAGLYYCSANGGSEIRDTDVSYYQNSVQEDIPTICYSEKPFYFGAELTRESIAELGISDDSPYWVYYGMTAMAYWKEQNPDHALWLHFNVVGEKYVSDTMDRIRVRRLSASESFENHKIFGYRLEVVDTVQAQLANRMEFILSLILEFKDFITPLLLLLIMGYNDLSVIETTITLVFFGLTVSLAAIHLFRWFAEQSDTKVIEIRTYEENPVQKFNEKLFSVGNRVDNIFFILSNMRCLLEIIKKE